MHSRASKFHVWQGPGLNSTQGVAPWCPRLIPSSSTGSTFVSEYHSKYSGDSVQTFHGDKAQFHREMQSILPGHNYC